MFGIPTPQTLAAKALCALVGALALLAAGAYGGYRWEKGSLADLKLADATAMTVATQNAADKQHRIDASGQAAAVAQAYLRGKLDATIINFNVEAPANVTFTQDQEAAASDHAGCITYGFYRMLYAGERGQAAASVALPPGTTVDTCTAEPPSELAAALAADLADGYGNGQQLDALIAELKRQEAIRLGKEDGHKPSGLLGEVAALPKEAAQ